LGAILVYLIAAYIFIKMFKAPWVAGVAYLAFGVMQPQYIWFWHFDGLPVSPSMILSVLAILAFGFAVLNKKIDFSIYKKKQNLILLIIWMMFHLSHQFSPFEIYRAGTSADIVLETLNTIMIMYFFTLGLITSENALKYMCILMGILITYYVYWSNDQYFSWILSQFSNGRLMGPRGSIYRDENVFSTLFMIGMPFLLFSFFYIKKWWLKYSIIMVVPLLWHSLFLVGSRGAMIATIIATLIASKLIKSKVFDKVLIVGFVVAITTQGGSMLDRSTEVVEQSQNSSAEEPLDPRLISWVHGIEIIKQYPLLGVGPQRFQHASRLYFPESTPYVAHNAFLNFSANTGLLTGILFIYLFRLAYRNYKFCVKNNIEEYPLLDYINKVCLTSLAGFFVCALFLDLIVFEGFYFLLSLNLAKQHVFEQRLLIKSSQHE
jgi:hypothetical protein